MERRGPFGAMAQHPPGWFPANRLYDQQLIEEEDPKTDVKITSPSWIQFQEQTITDHSLIIFFNLFKTSFKFIKMTVG